jgi:hypothetical protein
VLAGIAGRFQIFWTSSPFQATGVHAEGSDEPTPSRARDNRGSGNHGGRSLSTLWVLEGREAMMAMWWGLA